MLAAWAAACASPLPAPPPATAATVPPPAPAAAPRPPEGEARAVLSPRPSSAADLFAPPSVVDPQLSPDGELIAWRGAADGGGLRLRGVEAGAGEHVVPAAAEEGEVEAFGWGPQGDRLAVVRRSGGTWRLEIVEISAEGLPASVRPLYATAAALTLVAVVAGPPERVLAGVREAASGDDLLLAIDLADGGTSEVARATEVERWLVDAAGSARAAVLRGLDGSTRVVGIAGGRPGEPLLACTAEETCRVLALGPGGDRLTLASDRGGAARVGVAVLDLTTGALAPAAGDHAEPAAGDLAGALFAAGGTLLATWSAAGAGLELHDAAFAADWSRLSGALPPGELELVSSSADGERHLVLVDGGRALFLVDRRRGEVREVMRARPRLAPGAPVSRRVRYPARDGLSIPAELTLPTGAAGAGDGQAAAARPPAVLLPPDDPWRPRRQGRQPLVELLAERGYLVLQPSPRGSTGFGRAFRDAGDGQWGGAMLDDLADGVGWLVAEGLADPERVAIVGFGWGGYAAVASLAFTPDLYAAGVAVDGPLDLEELVGSSREPLRAALLRRRVGDPDDFHQRRRLRRHSPLAHAGAIRAPLLRIDLEGGVWSDPQGSQRLVAILRQLERPVETFVVTGGDGRLEGAAGAAVAREIERFLGHRLAPPAPAGRWAAGGPGEPETAVEPAAAGAGP